MLLSHRALFTANRLPAVRARSIGHAGKFWHYSTESATSTAAPLAKDAPVSDPLKGEFSTSPSATEAVRKTYSEISKKRLSENSKARESDAGSYTPWKPYNKDGPSITHTTSPWKSPPAKKEYSQSSQKLSPPKTAPTPPAPEPLLAKEPTESSDEPEAPRHPVEYTRSTVDINWHESFYGISTKVVTPKQHAILARPVETEDIEVKPDGIVYLPEVKYRRRLNEAFGPMGWGMVPRGEPVVGRTIVTREYALIVDGRFVAEAQGVNNYFNAEGLPAAIEGAKSNALMRCCKDLGIASDLWDPVFLRQFKKSHMQETWVENVITQKKKKFWFKKGLVDPVYPYKVAK